MKTYDDTRSTSSSYGFERVATDGSVAQQCVA